MRDDLQAYLDFAVGGTPSRFMRHDADWERLYRFIEAVAGTEASERPSDLDVRTALEASLHRRPEWVDEIMLVYEHGLALLDRR
ncbi:MAG: hypothetical protein R3C39_08395 [Dehalococcoidia bacterium]